MRDLTEDADKIIDMVFNASCNSTERTRLVADALRLFRMDLLTSQQAGAEGPEDGAEAQAANVVAEAEALTRANETRILELTGVVLLQTDTGIWRVWPDEGGGVRIDVCDPGDELSPEPEGASVVAYAGEPRHGGIQGRAVHLERPA